MRILIDIPEEQVNELATICTDDGKSRSAVIREAISCYLAQRRTDTSIDAFGLWADVPTDGLEYQRTLREEW